MEDPKPEISDEPAVAPEPIRNYDDDGEDLPDNFFDDFSNNDFMAGLDIVDDWVEENSTNSDKSRIETETEKKPSPKQQQSKKKSRSPAGKYKRKEVRRYRSRSRERRKRTPERRRSKERTQEAKSEEDRRDPEKTKRDIQRDKQRCAKDFEQRVLQEQLKVAESGLFPPGTELDVVLENEKKKAEAVPEEAPPKKLEKPAKSDRVRKSPPRRIKRSPRRSPSPRRRRSRSPRSPEYRRKRIFVRIERSPRERRRHRSRSSSLKRRSRSLDEKMRRNDDLRLQLRAKRRDRYMRDLSPVSESRPSRSPSVNLSSISKISKISDRELWLRNRSKYKRRSGGRSMSPRSRSGSFSSGGPADDSPLSKRSKHDSFIKEIERIAQIDKHSNSPVSIPEPVPPPLGCPYPGQYMMNMNQPYIPSLMEIPQMLDYHPPMTTMYDMPPMKMMESNIYPPRLPEIQQNTVQLQQHAVQLQQQRQQPIVVPTASPANKEVTKLFEEQKISLSDYLSVSAKPIDPATPINLHKKIKVISKCQEVIRILNDETRFSGRFIPKYVPSNAERPQESATMKWKSPLRKVFPLRFMFTTPSKKSATQESVKSLLNKLLLVCDIPVNAIDKSPTKINPPPPSPTKNFIPTAVPKPVPPPISFQIKEVKPKPPPIMKTEASQTDPVTCQICEIRNSRKYEETETQTLEMETEDQSTQVTQDDLTKSSVIFAPRGILKNAVQSLSHLTPAQLLALKQDNEWNTFPSQQQQQQQRQIPINSSSISGSGSGMGGSFNSQFSSNFNNFGIGMGMNYDNSRGMSGGGGGMGLGLYDSRNDMDMRQDFGDFRGNSGNIFGGHMPPQQQQQQQNPNQNHPNMRGGSNNMNNRNIFRNVWK